MLSSINENYDKINKLNKKKITDDYLNKITNNCKN